MLRVNEYHPNQEESENTFNEIFGAVESLAKGLKMKQI
jgi:hypothetical protein